MKPCLLWNYCCDSVTCHRRFMIGGGILFVCYCITTNYPTESSWDMIFRFLLIHCIFQIADQHILLMLLKWLSISSAVSELQQNWSAKKRHQWGIRGLCCIDVNSETAVTKKWSMLKWKLCSYLVRVYVSSIVTHWFLVAVMNSDRTIQLDSQHVFMLGREMSGCWSLRLTLLDNLCVWALWSLYRLKFEALWKA